MPEVEPLILQRSFSKRVFSLFISIVGLAAGPCIPWFALTIHPEGTGDVWWYWVCAAVWIFFFALFTVISLLHLFKPGASSVRLTQEGMTVSYLGFARFYRWEDVVCFAPYPGNERGLRGTVMFKLADQYREKNPKQLRLEAFTRLGFDDNFPDKFGMEAGALADLVTDYQSRSMGR
jgi:hypothetical protein